MPVQFPQNDQVPGLTYAGYSGLGAGIGSGISSGVQGLLAGIEKRKEERKRLAQAGKAADAFYKALPEDQLPIPPEDWALLSAPDKASAMQGIIGASQYKRGVADTQRFLEDAAQSKAERENMALAPEFWAEAGRLSAPQAPSVESMQAFYEGPGSAMPEERLRPQPAPGLSGVPLLSAAVSQTGYAPGQEEASLLRAMAPEGRLAARPPELLQLRPGVEAAWSPTTGKYDLIGEPQGGPTFDQKVQLLERGKLYDLKRSLITAQAGALPADKTKYQSQIDAVDAQIGQLGKTLRDQIAEAEAYAKQLEQERLKLEAELKGKTSGIELLPLPKSKSEMKAGQVYQTTRGPNRAAEGEMIMFDRQGNKVRVPRARLGEFSAKGYTPVQPVK